jgi:hypothetical protein
MSVATHPWHTNDHCFLNDAATIMDNNQFSLTYGEQASGPFLQEIKKSKKAVCAVYD